MDETMRQTITSTNQPANQELNTGTDTVTKLEPTQCPPALSNDRNQEYLGMSVEAQCLIPAMDDLVTSLGKVDTAFVSFSNYLKRHIERQKPLYMWPRYGQKKALASSIKETKAAISLLDAMWQTRPEVTFCPVIVHTRRFRSHKHANSIVNSVDAIGKSISDILNPPPAAIAVGLDPRHLINAGVNQKMVKGKTALALISCQEALQVAEAADKQMHKVMKLSCTIFQDEEEAFSNAETLVNVVTDYEIEVFRKVMQSTILKSNPHNGVEKAPDCRDKAMQNLRGWSPLGILAVFAILGLNIAVLFIMEKQTTMERQAMDMTASVKLLIQDIATAQNTSRTLSDRIDIIWTALGAPNPIGQYDIFSFDKHLVKRLDDVNSEILEYRLDAVDAEDRLERRIERLRKAIQKERICWDVDQKPCSKNEYLK